MVWDMGWATTSFPNAGPGQSETGHGLRHHNWDKSCIGGAVAVVMGVTLEKTASSNASSAGSVQD